jgi:hypothetical protein
MFLFQTERSRGKPQFLELWRKPWRDRIQQNALEGIVLEALVLLHDGFSPDEDPANSSEWYL